MSELDARYARGQDTRRMFGGGTIRNAGSVPGAWDVAPDLERILGEALFGTIWRRERRVSQWVGAPSWRRAPPPAPGERLRPMPIVEAWSWGRRGTRHARRTAGEQWRTMRLEGGHAPLGRRRAALSYKEDNHGRGHLSP
jgi:hypothetical protein